MNAELTLTRVMVGLSNIQQDHVMRHQVPNIHNHDLDLLLNSKLDNGMVTPDVLTEVANRTGGVATQATGFSYIEDGWGVSRGLAQLEFVITSNAMVEEKLVVVGYLTGGEVDYVDGIDPNIVFVPIRVWESHTRNSMDQNNFLRTKSKIASAAQILLNDNTAQGLHTIRPKDVIQASLSLAARADQDSTMMGGMDGETMTTGSTLSLVGMAMSNVQNNSPAHYAEDLLKSSLTAGDNMDRYDERYRSLADASINATRRESNVNDNAFISVMRNGLGRTSTTISGFEGFYIGEIAEVFENFSDVLVMDGVDESRVSIDDMRINNNDFGTSNMCELIANEILMLSQYLLIDNGLSILEVSGTNDLEDGAYEINGLPVDYLFGNVMPIADGLNINFETAVERVKSQITNHFFAKYCNHYYHARQLVSFNASFVLFGQTTIEVVINGDPSSARSYSFATFALNRFDPNLTNMETAGKATTGFYDNLVSHFNF